MDSRVKPANDGLGYGLLFKYEDTEELPALWDCFGTKFLAMTSKREELIYSFQTKRLLGFELRALGLL